MAEENRRLIEDYIEHYNSMNIEPMLDLFADDAEFESVSNTDGIIKTWVWRASRWGSDTPFDFAQGRLCRTPLTSA
jgi:hypothetical protein